MLKTISYSQRVNLYRVVIGRQRYCIVVPGWWLVAGGCDVTVIPHREFNGRHHDWLTFGQWTVGRVEFSNFHRHKFLLRNGLFTVSCIIVLFSYSFIIMFFFVSSWLVVHFFFLFLSRNCINECLSRIILKKKIQL